MRIQRIQKRSNKLAYLPVLIIMLSLTIITASTFAFFADRGGATGTVNFGKVELGDGTSAGVSRTIYDIMPGDAIIEDVLSFSKSSDSEPLYVRAKLSFSTTSTDETIAEFLSILRGFDASDFGISNTEIGTTGAKWSVKDGNYVYLVNADDDTTLFNVADTTTFALSNSIIVPIGLTQSVDEAGESTFSHYMESIKFNFAFQAIQSNNVDDTLATTSATFNEVFPESASEIIPVETAEYLDFLFQGNAVMMYIGTDTDIVIPSSYSILDTGMVEVPMTADELIMNINYGIFAWPITITAYNTASDMTYISHQAIVDEASYTTFRTNYNPMNVRILFETVRYCAGNDYLVTAIGDYVFGNCDRDRFNSITLSSGITSIGQNSFNSCHNLTTVVIPDSVSSISSGAFYDCSSLLSVAIPDGVTSIAVNTFDSCSSLTSVTFGVSSQLTSIGAAAFYNRTSLSSITIPNSVTSIGSAFAGCSGLTSVTFANQSDWYVTTEAEATSGTSVDVTNASTNATYFKNDYTYYYWKRGVQTVPQILDFVFDGDTVTGYVGNGGEVEIPSSYNILGIGVVERTWNINDMDTACSNVGNGTGMGQPISFPFTITAYNTASVSTYTACSQVVENYGEFQTFCMNSSAFNIRYSIETMLYGVGNNYQVTSIASNAFDFCYSLTSVTIPSGVTSIGDWAFSSCYNLSTISIPNSVTIIGNNVFSYCDDLTTITLPNTITSIGDGVFANCSTLATIVIPNSVISIGLGAFEACSSLTSITISESVQDIGAGAFAGCSGLISIILSKSVANIGFGAFSNCSGLTTGTVYYTGTSDDWSKMVIGTDNTPLTSASRVYNYGV